MRAKDRADRIIKMIRKELDDIPKDQRGTVVAMVFAYFATLYNKISPFLKEVNDDFQ